MTKRLRHVSAQVRPLRARPSTTLRAELDRLSPLIAATPAAATLASGAGNGGESVW